MKLLLVMLLALIFLVAVLLDKTYRAVPLKELRRRARSGHDKTAAAIYKMAAYGPSLELFLWLIGALGAAGLIILAAKTAWWLGLLLILGASWFMWLGQPLKDYGSWPWLIAGTLAPAVGKLLSWL